MKYVYLAMLASELHKLHILLHIFKTNEIIKPQFLQVCIYIYIYIYILYIYIYIIYIIYIYIYI